jgi:hypothetical protein
MASENFRLHNNSFRLQNSMKESMFKQRTSKVICAPGENHVMRISGLSRRRANRELSLFLAEAAAHWYPAKADRPSGP